MSSDPSPKLRKEIERLVAEIQARTLTSPDKAAKILARWADSPRKKTTTKDSRKKAA